MRAEQLTGPVAHHAEGPVWSPSWGGLRWVDMLAGDVLSFGAGDEIERLHVGTVAAALRPRKGGGAVIGVERGFALEDGDGELTYLDELWSDTAVRMNEGACDPDGRFYCGSMAYDKTPGAASIYRLDADGATSVVIDGVTVSNGLDWTPDGTLAFYNDTATRSIQVFDYDRDSGLTGRRTFVDVPEQEGHPDGLTVDSEGGVWAALNHGGQVRRYSPDGEVDAVIEVPVSQVTACTFGGEGLDELFVTTSRENLSPGDEPQAGSLFRAEPGIAGQPVREYSG